MTHSTSRTPEEWRPVAGYEGRYEVSDQGRVRSLPRPYAKARILAGGHSSGGYRSVALWRDNQPRTFRINRLVAAVFIRPPRDGEVCRHLNGDKLDNRAVNLAWGTDEDNAADTLRMGRHANANKALCRNGHPYSPENTYVIRRRSRNSIGRACKTCHQEGKRRRRAGSSKRRTSSLATAHTVGGTA